jgi:mono/diheme cytochrome c family protein
LIEVVTDGSFDPDSNMKGFTDRLSESEIADVIEFLKSTWGPKERYFQWSATWQETQQ